MFAIILLLTIFLTYIFGQVLLILMGWMTVNIQVPLINSLNNLLDIKLCESLQKEIYCVTLSDDIIDLASAQPDSIFSGSITHPKTGVVTGIITGTIKNNNFETLLVEEPKESNDVDTSDTETEPETEPEPDPESDTQCVAPILDISSIPKEKILVDESLD